MRPAVRGTLWVVFALLLALSGVRLLFGCALTMPAFLKLQFCPAPVDTSALDREKERRETLEERVRKAEIELARIAPCATCTPATPISVQPEFAVLLDMTGSMDDEPKPALPGAASLRKIDIVKRDLPPALEEFGDRTISYMEFRNCNETRNLRSVPGRALAQQIRSLPTPDGRGAHIASALKQAADSFHAGPDGRYYGNILIITDTGRECVDDPCVAAQEVATQKPGIAVNVVDLENSDVLRCLSVATGGRFFPRGAQVDLRQIMQEAKSFPGREDCPPGAAPPVLLTPRRAG